MRKKNNADTTDVFTRRAIIVGGIQGALLAVLGGRLAWLQIAQGEKYKTLSDQNRVNIKMLAPSRGEIVDKFGVPLALNNRNFRVVIIREQSKNIEKSLEQLQNIINIDERKIKKAIKEISKTAKFVPVEVKDNLTWDEVAKIEVNMPDLSGLEIEVGERRSYPLSNATAHLIGYVGAVNETELLKDKSLGLPGIKIGKNAIEKQYDLLLRGKAGNAKMEVNVLGREVRELEREERQGGQRVVLSVDAPLQKLMQDRLNQERSASAVVMDVKTGGVFALASSPSFDPHAFIDGISADRWEALLSDPANPLTNKAISGQYPPGSTFKMVTALAGLEAGVISPDRHVFCPGHFELGKARFHCWKKEGHGSVNVVSALEESCDVFFYKVSREMGIDKIAQMSRRLGLGSKLDFDLPEERPGLIPDVEWKKSYMGEPWHPGETIVASIGQGYMLATPLQLAVMTSRLVNGGLAVKPWLMMDHAHSQATWPSMNLNQTHLAMVLDGMNRVVNGERGTAKGSKIKDITMAMGGKTGTAQVRRITMQQRAAGVKNKDLPWKHRHHALFVGYAPVHDPIYACAVVVEHGVSGSGAAAPLAKYLLEETQKRNPAGRTAKPLISEELSLLKNPALKE
jgi:penicillin-binding protein 2